MIKKYLFLGNVSCFLGAVRRLSHNVYSTGYSFSVTDMSPCFYRSFEGLSKSLPVIQETGTSGSTAPKSFKGFS